MCSIVLEICNLYETNGSNYISVPFFLTGNYGWFKGVYIFAEVVLVYIAGKGGSVIIFGWACILLS